MPDADGDRVSERVALWQRWWASGRDLPAEDLCRDCPELVGRIAAEIELLRSSGDTAYGVPTPPGIDVDPSAHVTAPNGLPSTASLDALPHIGTEWGKLIIPAQQDAEPPERIGDYRVLKVLGRGGMGTVYLAEDVRLNRLAAVKMMRTAAGADATARARFLREARAAARLNHDHVIPIWQVGETPEGLPFIAMPALNGETLEARLRRDGKASLALTLKVAREVSQGLAAAHMAGLVHRDVKPANVWLESAGTSKAKRCKILDFGLVRDIELGDQRLTASGTIQGTPSYVSPEQAHGEPADHRSDLFSLGVVLYRMTTGELPFRGLNIMAVIYAVTTLDPPPPHVKNPQVPGALSDLVMRLLSKEPSGRPRTAADVVSEVRKLSRALRPPKNGHAPPSRPPMPMPRPVYAPPPPMPAPPPAPSVIMAPPAAWPQRVAAIEPPAPSPDEVSDVYPWELRAARDWLRPGLRDKSRHEPPPPEPVSGGLIVALGLAGLLAVGAVLATAVTAEPTAPAKAPPTWRR